MASVSSNLPRYKIVMVGEAGVGKTSTWIRFKTGRSVSETGSTVGVDMAHRVMDVPGEGRRAGERVELQLWDTGGKELRHGALTGNYYRGSHVILFMFSTDDKESLSNLTCWLDEALQYAGTNPLFFFLCNKDDLEDDEREVTISQIQNFFYSNTTAYPKLVNALTDRLFYTSAKDACNQGLDDALRSIVGALQSRGKEAAFTDSFKLDREKEKRENGGEWKCASMC